MLGARFADEDGEVDEAGRNDIAAAIDDPHAFGQHIGADRLAHASDYAIRDKHAAAHLRQRGRVDEARVNECQRWMGHGA